MNQVQPFNFEEYFNGLEYDPTLIMMIGLPCSGKTTFIKEMFNEFAVVSSDALIEEHAKENGKTYNEVFKDYVGTANQIMYGEAHRLAKDWQDIVWDQTNLSKKIRAKKLSILPPNYFKKAVVFPPRDPELLFERMKEFRPEKVIPLGILKSMAANYEPPSIEEGFSVIEVINS